MGDVSGPSTGTSRGSVGGQTVTAVAQGKGLSRCTALQPTVIRLTTRDSATGRLVSVGHTAFSTRVTAVNGAFAVFLMLPDLLNVL